LAVAKPDECGQCIAPQAQIRFALAQVARTLDLVPVSIRQVHLNISPPHFDPISKIQRDGKESFSRSLDQGTDETQTLAAVQPPFG
jgi:hypothetical protein